MLLINIYLPDMKPSAVSSMRKLNLEVEVLERPFQGFELDSQYAPEDQNIGE